MIKRVKEIGNTVQIGLSRSLVVLFCLTALGHVDTAFAQKINTTLTYSVNQPGVKSAKIPVLIMMHGYGSNEADLLSISKVLDGRFITFSLRAPNDMGGGGYNWFEIQRLENGERKYNHGQAQQSRDKVLSFISNACKAYKLDSTQVYLIGFSQGAIMSYELAVYAPNKIRGVMALSGRLMAETSRYNIDLGGLGKVKFFIGHGTGDEVIKPEESQKAETFLKVNKVSEVLFKKYTMAHSISEEEINDIKVWLTKSLKP